MQYKKDYLEWINVTYGTYPIASVLVAPWEDYYCTLTAYDDNGNESAESNIVPLDDLAPAASGNLRRQ